MSRPRVGNGQQPPVVTSSVRVGRDGCPAYCKRSGKDRNALDDKEILGHIDDLVQTEHELRARLAAGALFSDEERVRLRAAEEALDQCWDLLRQRRARREFGENPDDAAVRPVPEVEGYQQ